MRRTWDPETLAVLAGELGDEGDHAVRKGELAALLRQLLTSGEAEERSAFRGVESFRAGRDPGVYTWRLGSSMFPPPLGIGGGALYLPRHEKGVGTWIAADASGRSTKPALFAMTTSGTPDDWGGWYEIFTQARLLEPVAFENGVPSGGAMERITSASGQAWRFANGLQICDHRITIAFQNASQLSATWVFPAAFDSAVKCHVTLPADTATNFVGVGIDDVSYVGASQGDTASATIYCRRAAGAPAFSAGAEIRNVGVTSFGIWGS